MPEVSRFEELIGWQKARALTAQVYRVTRKRDFSRDFGLANQIQRAAVSTMSNIAEGFERGRRREFHQLLSTAKASCAEVRSLLYVASDVGYLESQEFSQLMDQASEVSRIVGGLRAAVARQIDAEGSTARPRHDSTKSPRPGARPHSPQQ
jgi:four helix bundle protein